MDQKIKVPATKETLLLFREFKAACSSIAQ
jgi:hypothetical protein